MSDEKLIPNVLTQNPTLVKELGQEYEKAVRGETENILITYFNLVPDVYLSEVVGPNYTLYFQAAAEYLARIRISAQEVFEDNDYDFTRPDFLFQVLGSLLFPGGGDIPEIEGDVSYRSFLKALLLLVLQGSKASVVKSGVELLTRAEVEHFERFLFWRDTDLPQKWIEQFGFELLVDGETALTEDVLAFLKNAEIVIKTLKPAHTYYELSFLFKEYFGENEEGEGVLFEDESSFEMSAYYYEDYRKFCAGAKQIASSEGQTWTDRTLFSDVTVSFKNISQGAVLHVSSGNNEGYYIVDDVLSFPVGTDTTARAYTTFPSSLSGTATVDDDVITDLAQDFSSVEEGEVFTFTEGPNAGSYRLDTFLGSEGGPIGTTSPSSTITSVRISPSLLRLRSRMIEAAISQDYTVSVDRMGVLTARVVTGEDVSQYFYL